MGTLIQNTSTKGKIGMAGAAIGVLLVAIMLMKMATSPSYSTIATGVDPAQTGKMTAALDTKGIKWKLVNNGTGIAVDSGQTAGARVALAEQGLPQNGQAGFELFDKQKLGASQPSAAGDLPARARGRARPDDRAGAGRDQRAGEPRAPRGAAVQRPELPVQGLGAALHGRHADRLELRARHRAARGRRREGAPAPERLDHRLQRPAALAHERHACGNGPSASLKQAAQSRYNQQLGAQLQAMLDQTVGAGKGTVQVNADLNVDQTSKDALLYAKKGVPLTQSKTTEKLKGSGSATGTSGTGSNIPSYARRRLERRQQLQQQRPQHHLRRQQDGVPHQGGARRGEQARRGGAGGQVGAAGHGGAAPVRARRGRGHHAQARRHDHGEPGGIHQAAGGHHAQDAAQPDRLRQVRPARASGCWPSCSSCPATSRSARTRR